MAVPTGNFIYSICHDYKYLRLDTYYIKTMKSIYLHEYRSLFHFFGFEISSLVHTNKSSRSPLYILYIPYVMDQSMSYFTPIIHLFYNPHISMKLCPFFSFFLLKYKVIHMETTDRGPNRKFHIFHMLWPKIYTKGHVLYEEHEITISP